MARGSPADSALQPQGMQAPAALGDADAFVDPRAWLDDDTKPPAQGTPTPGPPPTAPAARPAAARFEAPISIDIVEASKPVSSAPSAPAPSAAASATNQTSPGQTPGQTKKAGKRGATWVVVIALLVLAAGAGVFVFREKLFPKAGNPAPASTPPTVQGAQ
jgi:hypothetical protein